MVIEKLKAMKKEGKVTNQQWAELSGVPASTIARILSGETPTPQFPTVANLVKAIGGSLDEFWEIPPKIIPAEQVEAPTSELITLYREMLDEKGRIIQEKDLTIKEQSNALKEKRKEIKILLLILGTTLVSIILVLLFDLFNGNFGYFRY